MTKEEKGLVIDELVQKLENCAYFYITDASEMTVAATTDFRRSCFKKGVEYKVYKNTLIKKAMDKLEQDYTDLEPVLVGFSGILFSPEIGNAPAKLLKEFRKDGGEKPLLKGAYIDTDVFVGDENLDALSKLKSKNDLIAEVVALLQSPAKNVVSALQSGGGKLAGILKTLSEKEA